ncbi:MAG: (d)CMP kinase [Hungatella hathewayi]|nr:(d)CMP kinase [Hungatella hathewayi]
MSTSYNIAIDGPAGAGKSTIAKKAAAKLGFIYVDTGAMYRAMALYFIRHGIAKEDEAAIGDALRDIDISIRYEDGAQQVILNGENVSGLIRTEEVGNMASASSAYGAVREKLLELQRSLARSSNVIMDGRDIGTCVLPQADTKIYLTASSRVRAMRRYKELNEKGQMCNLEEIEQDIIERDYRDMHREIAPLKQAEDAVLVDTSDMDIDEVVDAIIDLAVERGLESSPSHEQAEKSGKSPSNESAEKCGE